MIKWLLRWFGRAPAEAARAKATSPAAAGVRHDAVHPAGVPTGAQRRPLVGRQGRISGFEFVLSPARREVWRAQAGSANAAAAVGDVLVDAAREAAAGGRRNSLVVLEAAMLEDVAVRVAASAPAGAGLMIAALDRDPAPEALAAWRGLGVRVGLRDGPPAARTHADFIVLLAADGGLDTLVASAERWHRARPGAPLVALGLAGIEEVEQALAAGVTLAGGRLGGGDAANRPPPAGAAGRLDPAAHRICELMNLLALDRDAAEVAEAFRRDAALAYRVLRFANSPALGLSRPAESIEQAIALLGQGELQRWLGVLLLSSGRSRPASEAVQEHALTRAFVLEELARRAGEPRPSALFTLGLLSQADRLLGVSLAAALQTLRLPPELPLALLQHEGPWAPYLSVARALDGDDVAALEEAAQPFGGSAQVLDAAANAWQSATKLASTRR